MMKNLLRRFGLRREPSAEGQAKHTTDEDFFAFRQFGTCGFPNKPSCLALDDELGLLAIGTKTGFIHVFGRPGVHLQGKHEFPTSVIHISFLKGKSKLVTVCEDGSFVIWVLKTSENEFMREETVRQSENEEASNFDSLLVRGERKKLNQVNESNKISCCCLDERNIHPGTTELKSAPEDGPSPRSKTTSSEETKVASNPRLFVGMTDGNAFVLPIVGESHVDVSLLEERSVGEVALSHDEVVVDHFSEEEVKYLGFVVSIVLHPTMSHKVLVGYSAGFSVMWNTLSLSAESVFSAYQQLENLAFNHDGSEFISSHSDGSYIIWSTIDCTEPREPASTPYGPYQCEAINKFVWKTNESSSLMIFSGGMPRSGYGDRWTVTIMRGDGDDGGQSHVVLDLTSRVIDFVVVDSLDGVCEVDAEADETMGPSSGGFGNGREDKGRWLSTSPHSLVVLAEEEMVVVDLVGRDWPSYRLPHLTSPHCSAITSVFHASEVPDAFLAKLSEAGRLQQMKNVSFTRKTWPFLGGKSMFSKDRERDLLLTGHEDGSVRFWQTKHGDIQLLYRLDTAHLFGIELSNNSEQNNDSDEDWPPFKKIGAYNPFTDDPRLAIRQIILSTGQDPETLVLSGTAGQIVVCEFNSEDRRRVQRKSSRREEEARVGSSAAANVPTRSSDPGETVLQACSSQVQACSSQVQAVIESTPREGDRIEVIPPNSSAIEMSSSSHVRINAGSGEGASGIERGSSEDAADVPTRSACGSSAAASTQKTSHADDYGIVATEQRVTHVEVEENLPNSDGASGRVPHVLVNRESYSSSLSSASVQFEIKVSSVNLVGDRDDFVWMGHTPLEVVNPNNNDKKNRTRVKSATSNSPSSVFMPYPLVSSASCSALGDGSPGFHASCVVLVHPPVSCTSLALHANWQLIGFGSEYGYGLYDYALGKIIFSKGLKSDSKNGRGSTAFGENSRFSDALRRTVRASFRTLERARSEFRERRRKSQHSMWKSFSASRGTTGHSTGDDPSSNPHSTSAAAASAAAAKEASSPMEEKVHSKSEKPFSSMGNNSEPHKRNQNAGINDLFQGGSIDRDPQSASLSRAGTPIVRCLYFAEDASPPPQSAASVKAVEQPEFGTFWVGTSQGTIYMYSITIPPPCRRLFQPVIHSLAKEIHLRHEAPVLDICILNKSGSPLHSDAPHYPMPVVARNRRWKFPSSIFGSLIPSSSSGQCLVVCSQKQVKVFSYPGLKAKRKVKMDRLSGGCGDGAPIGGISSCSRAAAPEVHSPPAVDGGCDHPTAKNITKVAYSSFEKKSDESVVESGLVCLTDDGGATIYSMPSLKLRFSTSAVSKEFMSDMKLCVLTSHGYGFYLCSPSEFGKFSVSSMCPKMRSLSLQPTRAMLFDGQKRKDFEGFRKSSSEEENFKRTPNSGSLVEASEVASASGATEVVVVDLNDLGAMETKNKRSNVQSGSSGGSNGGSGGTAALAEEAASALEPVVAVGKVSTETASKDSERFKKVTDISYIKDEQTIEKIISKFVQMDVPGGGRREIQFSIPVQQDSPARIGGAPCPPSEEEEEAAAAKLVAGIIDVRIDGGGNAETSKDQFP